MCEYFDIEMDEGRRLLAGVNEGAVVFCHIAHDPGDTHRILDGERRFFSNLRKGTAESHPLIDPFREYLAGSPVDPVSVPVRWTRGTDFQLRVWKTLRGVRRGQVVSYGDLAVMADSPRACRAVGSAMARNYLVLCVPCHRVVARDGMGGFSGGLNVKRHWLHLEGMDLKGGLQEDS